MKQAPTHVIVKKGCLHWYGCLICHASEHLTLQHLKFELAGAGCKRPRGRSHVRWMDIIDGDATKLILQTQLAREVVSDYQQCHTLLLDVGPMQYSKSDDDTYDDESGGMVQYKGSSWG